MPALFLGVVLSLPSPDVIHLSSGERVVGEVVRESSAEVAVVSPDGPHAYHREAVASITPAKDLRRMFAEAQAAMGEPSEHGLATLCRFCLDRGLYDELFDTLDAWSARAPEGERLRTLREQSLTRTVLQGIGRCPPFSRKVLDSLLYLAGGDSPSRSSVALDWLALDARDETTAAARALLNHTHRQFRRGAARFLGLVPKDHVNLLVKSSLLDSDSRVRDAALEGALRTEHRDLALPYMNAIQSPDPRTRNHAYEALEMMRDPRAVPALIERLNLRSSSGHGLGPKGFIHIGEERTYVQDFEVEIAQGAVIADPVIGVLQTGVTLQASAASFSVPVLERRKVVALLRRYTGQELDDSFELWASWWQDSGSQFLAGRTQSTQIVRPTEGGS